MAKHVADAILYPSRCSYNCRSEKDVHMTLHQVLSDDPYCIGIQSRLCVRGHQEVPKSCQFSMYVDRSDERLANPVMSELRLQRGNRIFDRSEEFMCVNLWTLRVKCMLYSNTNVVSGSFGIDLSSLSHAGVSIILQGRAWV